MTSTYRGRDFQLIFLLRKRRIWLWIRKTTVSTGSAKLKLQRLGSPRSSHRSATRCSARSSARESTWVRENAGARVRADRAASRPATRPGSVECAQRCAPPRRQPNAAAAEGEPADGESWPFCKPRKKRRLHDSQDARINVSLLASMGLARRRP